jgi:hypothetical protein
MDCGNLERMIFRNVYISRRSNRGHILKPASLYDRATRIEHYALEIGENQKRRPYERKKIRVSIIESLLRLVRVPKDTPWHSDYTNFLRQD